MDLKDLLKNISEYVNKEVVLEGWVRNNRNQSNFGFIDKKDVVGKVIFRLYPFKSVEKIIIE